jgi:periplasmic protein TonB
MTALIEVGRTMKRQEIFRWLSCALVVLLAHGLAALALVQRDDETDMDAGSPVALIELAPIPVAPSATVSDLHPGPPAAEAAQRDPMDASEKPLQDEPPIQQAVQAPDSTEPPPAPETPKKQMADAEPQPPVDASTAAAPPAAVEAAVQPAAPAAGHAAQHPSATALRWQSSLVAHLERSKRYPREASGQTGVARLAFRIDRQGHLLDCRILQSSGSAILDAETLALARRAEPFPAPPKEVADNQLSFVAPIRYASSLRR